MAVSKHLCNIHNYSIELMVKNYSRERDIHKYLMTVVDGFSKYFVNEKTDKKIIIRDIYELNILENALVVPENAWYFNGVFYSREAKIAFQMTDFGMNFWAYENVWYLPYVLQLLLEEEQKTFIHGAGVTVNGKDGYLLSAFGGIGKTCFIANALKKNNVKLLGDDLIIIGKDGFCYSYPRPFCLYEYHRSLFPQYFERKKLHFEMLTPDRYFLRISKRIKKVLKIRDRIIYDYIPVSPIHLFPKEKLQVQKTKIKKIFLLRRIYGMKQMRVYKASDIGKAANFTYDVILHEWSVGLRLEYNYFAHKEENYAQRAIRRYEIISSAFRTADEVWYIDIPEDMGTDTVSTKLNEIIIEGKMLR